MRYDRIYNVILVVAAGSSYLLFYFENYITMFISSRGVCDSPVLGNLQWIIPKLIFRCDMLDDVNMQTFPKIGVMVVLDLWIIICCVLGFIYSIFRSQNITDDDLTDYWFLMKCGRQRLEYARSFYRCLFIFGVVFVFVYSPAIDDGSRFGFICLLSKYGLGALLHAVFAMTPSYSIFMTILSFRTLEKFSRGSMVDSTRPPDDVA